MKCLEKRLKKYLQNPLVKLYIEGTYMQGKSVADIKAVLEDSDKYDKELLRIGKRKAKAIVKQEQSDDVIVTMERDKDKKIKRKKHKKSPKNKHKRKRSRKNE